MKKMIFEKRKVEVTLGNEEKKNLWAAYDTISKLLDEMDGIEECVLCAGGIDYDKDWIYDFLPFIENLVSGKEIMIEEIN